MEVSNGSGWASADVVRIVEAAHRFATKHAAANGSGRPLLAGTTGQRNTVMALPPSLSIRRSSYVRCYHHDSRLTLMLESPSTAKATPLEAIATGSVGQRKLIRQAVYAVARNYCTCDSADEGLDALIESESLVLTLKTSKDKKDTQRAKLTRLTQTMTNARSDLVRSQHEVARLTTYLAESEKERARLIEALDKAGRKRGG